MSIRIELTVEEFKEALSIYNVNVDDAMEATGQSIEDFGKKLTEVQDQASKDLAEIEKDAKELAEKKNFPILFLLSHEYTHIKKFSLFLLLPQ